MIFSQENNYVYCIRNWRVQIIHIKILLIVKNSRSLFSVFYIMPQSGWHRKKHVVKVLLPLEKSNVKYFVEKFRNCKMSFIDVWGGKTYSYCRKVRLLCWVDSNYTRYFFFLSDLKSRYDEEKSLREAADQRLAHLAEQLQKEKQGNERLQTELVTTPTSFCCFFLVPLVELCAFTLPPSCSDREWRMWRFCRRSWSRFRHWWTKWPVRGRRSRNGSETVTQSFRLTTLPQRLEAQTYTHLYFAVLSVPPLHRSV